MNSDQRMRVALPALISIVVAWMLTGCGGPIEQSARNSTSPVPIVFDSDRDPGDALLGTARKYDWRFDGNNCAIERQVVMPFMAEPKVKAPPLPRLKVSDWIDRGFPASVEEILRLASQPEHHQPRWKKRFETSDLAGSLAFDLSADGKRVLVVGDKRIELLDAESGKSLGSIPVPDPISGPTPKAILFAPQSKDFLVGTADAIVRVSGKTGKVANTIKGPGEAILKWEIADDESYWVLRTESGRLLAGLPDDNELKTLDFGELSQTQVPSFDLSPNGRRLLTIISGQHRRFDIRDGQLIDAICPVPIELSNNAIVSAISDQSTVVCSSNNLWFHDLSSKNPNKQTSESTDIIPNYWRFHQLHPVGTPDESNGDSLMAIAERIHDGQRQPILCEIDPDSRDSSLPWPLKKMPERMVCDRFGDRLLLLINDELQCIDWISGFTHDENGIMNRVDRLYQQDRFDDLVVLFEFLGEKEFAIQTESSSDLLARLFISVSGYIGYNQFEWDTKGESAGTFSKDRVKGFKRWVDGIDESSATKWRWKENFEAGGEFRIWQRKVAPNRNTLDPNRGQDIAGPVLEKLKPIIDAGNANPGHFHMLSWIVAPNISGLPKLDAIFRENEARFPHSRYLPLSMVRHGSVSRGGTHQDCFMFAKRLADRHDGDWGFGLYACLAGQAARYVDNYDFGYQYFADDYLFRGIEAYLKQYPDSGTNVQRMLGLVKLRDPGNPLVDVLIQRIREGVAFKPTNFYLHRESASDPLLPDAPDWNRYPDWGDTQSPAPTND